MVEMMMRMMIKVGKAVRDDGGGADDDGGGDDGDDDDGDEDEDDEEEQEGKFAKPVTWNLTVCHFLSEFCLM